VKFSRFCDFARCFFVDFQQKDGWIATSRIPFSSSLFLPHLSLSLHPISQMHLFFTHQGVALEKGGTKATRGEGGREGGREGGNENKEGKGGSQTS
jgi:hypothetical protein